MDEENRIVLPCHIRNPPDKGDHVLKRGDKAKNQVPNIFIGNDYFAELGDDKVDEYMAREFLRLHGPTSVPLSVVKTIEPILRKIVLEEEGRKSQSGGDDVPPEVPASQRAIEAVFEKDLNALCNYGHSIHRQFRDYRTAERIYRRVLELGPSVKSSIDHEFPAPNISETETAPTRPDAELLDRFYVEVALPIWESAPRDILGPDVPKPPLLREDVDRLADMILAGDNSSAARDVGYNTSALGLLIAAAAAAAGGGGDAAGPPPPDHRPPDSRGAYVDALARLAELRCE